MKASKASKSVDLSAKLKQIMSKSDANDRHYAACMASYEAELLESQ